MLVSYTTVVPVAPSALTSAAIMVPICNFVLAVIAADFVFEVVWVVVVVLPLASAVINSLDGRARAWLCRMLVGVIVSDGKFVFGDSR